MFKDNKNSVQEQGDFQLTRLVRHELENGQMSAGDLGKYAAAFTYENAEPKYDVDTAFKFSMSLFAGETVMSRESMPEFVDGVIEGIRLSESLLRAEEAEAEPEMPALPASLPEIERALHPEREEESQPETSSHGYGHGASQGFSALSSHEDHEDEDSRDDNPHGGSF